MLVQEQRARLQEPELLCISCSEEPIAIQQTHLP